MNEPTPLRTILVGTDNSTAAQRALTWAAARSRETGAQLVVVHVLTYSHEFATDLSLATVTTWRRNLERDLAGQWTDAARAIGATVRTLIVEDESTAAGILAAAQREHADLVVLGAHGRGNLADRLLGATTYTVTHRARTPVVIIPPDWQPAAA
jgi:nucleotide-binding universal stress UspA family protein